VLSTDVEPRCSRERAAVLSVKVQTVASRMSYCWASMSWWHTAPVCSRSELVMSPAGLSVLTSREHNVSENGNRQSSGARRLAGSSQTPPMPVPEASTVPRKRGSESTSSPQRVGREARDEASQRKSSSWSCTASVSRKRSEGFGSTS
jgi:hypothetical protein